MSTTSFGEIALVDPSQLGKAATVDTALAAIDSMINGIMTIDAATVGSNPYTVPFQAGDEPAAQKPAIRFVICYVTGSLSSPFTMIFPVGPQRLFIIQNNTSGGQNVIAMGTGGTGVTIPAGTAFLCFLNGTDVVQPPIQVAQGTQPWDVGNFIDGQPGSGQVIMRFIVSRTITFPANFANNQMKCATPPTSTASFSINKNGSLIGNASIAASATSATWTSVGGTSYVFNAGDIGTFIAPSPPDATLADLEWVFSGTR